MNWSLPLSQLSTLRRKKPEAVLVPFSRTLFHPKPHILEGEGQLTRLL